MNISLRALTANADLHRVPPLEQAIWGNPDPIPDSLLRVMVDHGGAVLVASPGGEPDRWLGFLVALPGRDGAGWYLHSHLAGVLAPQRGLGIGRAMKLAERDWARAEGYSRICWTFDPLRAENAHFNLERLGVRVLGYRADYYGSLESLLNRALPTDRLLVEWPTSAAAPRAAAIEGDRTVYVPIPRDVEAVIRADPAEARRIQAAARGAFSRYLAAGFEVAGFEREADPPRYVLRRRTAPAE